MSRGAKVAGVVGALVLIVGLIWKPVIEPQVVKFPKAVNRAQRYEGTLTVYVDQTTGAPLAQPQTTPLTIDRTLTGISKASGAHVTLVDETLSYEIGVATQVQENIYAINRSNGKNVKNSQAVTFVKGNAVDRSGSYTVWLPRNVRSHGAAYPLWQAETGTTYTVHNASPSTGEESGTHVVYLTGQAPPAPVAPYEQKLLIAQGFPDRLTSTQLAAALQPYGIDLYETLSVLTNILTPTEMDTVTAAVSRGVPLQYYSSSQANIAVEPRTGIIVKTSNGVRAVSVKADTSGLGPVLAALTPHSSDPTVASLLSTLTQVATAPAQPVFDIKYNQTATSVGVDASYAKSQSRRLRLASFTIPSALVVAGLILLLISALLTWRGRRRARAAMPLPQQPSPGRPDERASTGGRLAG